MTILGESRGAKALRMCQELCTDKTWGNVCRILASHPCVAYGFSIEWDEDDSDCVWSHSMLTSLQLLQIAAGQETLKNGQLFLNRREQWSADQIELALVAVAECVTLIRNIHVRFTLLVHVPGQPVIGVYFKPKYGNIPSFHVLADDLAFSVELLSLKVSQLTLS